MGSFNGRNIVQLSLQILILYVVIATICCGE